MAELDGASTKGVGTPGDREVCKFDGADIELEPGTEGAEWLPDPPAVVAAADHRHRIALEQVREVYAEVPEVQLLVEFIENSSRGICRSSVAEPVQES